MTRLEILSTDRILPVDRIITRKGSVVLRSILSITLPAGSVVVRRGNIRYSKAIKLLDDYKADVVIFGNSEEKMVALREPSHKI